MFFIYKVKILATEKKKAKKSITSIFLSDNLLYIFIDDDSAKKKIISKFCSEEEIS